MKIINQILAELRHLDIKIWVDGENLCYRAPKKTLSPILREQLQKHKKEIILFLNKANCARNSHNFSVLPISRNIDIPLSLNQERLWYLEQLNPESSVYNLSVAFNLVGLFEFKILEWSLETIVQRHEILRTIFRVVEGKPISVISDKNIVKISEIDLQGFTKTEQEVKVKELVNKDAQHPFDLVEKPLWRLTLLRLGTEEHVLQLTMHHIISDGASFSIFFQEFSQLYQAYSKEKNSHLPELSIQYADFAYSHHKWLQSEMLGFQLAYWKQQMSGSVPVLKLPIAPVTPTVQSYQGDSQYLVISEDLTNSLKLFSQKEGVTLFTILLTVFNILLYQYTKQEDIVLCSPFSARTASGTQELIGFFNNILPIRTNLSGNPNFLELLYRVGRLVSEANENQDVPFQLIMDFPNLLRSSISKVLFGFQSISQEFIELPEINITAIPIQNGTANFDLGLFVDDRKEILKVKLEYKTSLFRPKTVSEILENFHILLQRLIAHPDQHLSSLPSFKPFTLEANSVNEAECHAQPLLNQTRQESEETFVAPSNELEFQLSQIWQKVLGIQPISIKDNFFNLGGHSLLAVRLFNQIEEEFHNKIPITTLLQAPTIEQLASLIRKKEWSVQWRSLVSIQPLGVKTPLFCIHAIGVSLLYYRRLAVHLGLDQPFYGLQAQGLNGKQPPLTKIEDMAAHYIKEIQTIQAEGPYLVGGFSFGGKVAWEIAQQLTAQGETVALLILFDSTAPGCFTQIPVHQRLIDHFNNFWKFGPNYILKKITGRFLRFKHRIKEINQRNSSKLSDQYTSSLDNIHPNKIVQRANQQAVKKYVPQVYPGKVTLFRATHQLTPEGWQVDPQMGWGKLASGELEVYEVPGGHTSMFREPHVQVLSEKLRVSINNALKED